MPTTTSADGSQRSPSATIPSLDGVRAVAVSLVFLAHGGLYSVVPGGLGVTAFFVLSGYLITTLLRQEQARSGSISLRNFYLRRWLRLMPPLLVVVAAAAALSAAAVIDGRFSSSGLLAVLFHFGNYYVVFHDFHGLPEGLGVVWSLAVEEHYYLLYPPLLILLLRLQRRRGAALLLAGLCAAVLAWRCWLAAAGWSEDYIGMATDTRIDAILIGCLLGLMQNPWLDAGRATSSRGCGIQVALCLLLLLASLALRQDYFRQTLRYTVQSLAIAPLLGLAVAQPRHWAFRWLQQPVLVYIGRVSYSIYLSHHLLLGLVQRHWPQLGTAMTLALTLILTLAVAEAIRRWIEQPCMEWRRKLRHASPPASSLPASGITPTV